MDEENEMQLTKDETNHKERLKSIVDGIVIDIQGSEEALSLIKVIGNNGENIKAHHYEKLFGRILESLKLQLIVLISRIFEKPKGNDIKSIPFVIGFIESNKDNLDIYNREEYIKSLIRLEMNVTDLIKLNYVEINDKCIEHFRKILPKPKQITLNQLGTTLGITKWQRDKSFVHNEIIEDKNKIGPSIQGILDLIDIAKKFVIAFGWGYTGTPYGTCNEWYLTFDTERVKDQMNKLLKVSKIIKVI
jgi:hypothetical protein